MPNEGTSSQSQNAVIPINGGGEIQSDTEEETQLPRKPYVLEDFSQQRINRGQQKINYLIVEVNEKIVEALNQLKIAVAVGASCGKVNLGPVEAAIKEVSEAADKVAGEFPPGCGDPN